MEKFKFETYLEDYDPRSYNRYDSNYDSIKDYTFDLWFTLKKGASLKTAILTFVEEMDIFRRTCRRFAICVSDDESVTELGEEKEFLLKLCEENSITLLRNDGGTYYNYHDGREYCIHEEEGYGMVDDAATYLFIWWHKIPTAEEEEEKRLRELHYERQRTLRDGKETCKKYCLQNLTHVEQMEKRLNTMMNELNVKREKIGKVEKADASFADAMILDNKMRTLDFLQKSMAGAREYLLSPEELE